MNANKIQQHIREHDALGLPAPGQISNLLKNKNTLVEIGDSWVAAETTAAGASAARGVFRNVNINLGNYFEIVNIAGGSGENLAEIQARFATDVLAYNTGYAFLIGGENDAAQGRTAEQMFASTKLMIDSAVNNGVILIVCPCQLTQANFVNDTSAADVNNTAKQVSLYNRMLLTYSMQKSGWIYASKAWDGITDQNFSEPTYSQYVPAIKSEYQIDAGHVNHAGAFRVGKDIAAQLNDLFYQPDMFPRHDNDFGKGCVNPMMRTTTPNYTNGIAGGAGITGTPPSGWYARIRNAGTGVCTVSQVPRDDIVDANWFKGVCTAMQSIQNIEFRESDTAAFNYANVYKEIADYDIAVGDTVELYAEIKIHSISGTVVSNGELNQVIMSAQMTNAANGAVDIPVLNISSGSTSDPYVGSDFEDVPLVIHSARYVIPENTVKWYVWFNANIQSGATGDTDFTFEIGRVGIRKIA